MENTVKEMKNTLEEILSRITEAGKWICDLQDIMVEISAAEQNKEKTMKRKEDCLRDLWDIKGTNIEIIGVQKKKKRNGLRKYLKRL